MKDNKKKQLGLIGQIYILVLVAILIIAGITYAVEHGIQRRRTITQVGERAAHSAGEVISSLKEYPACEWLLEYWETHADALQIEYDAAFTDGTLTREKCDLLAQRHPDLQLRYCSSEELTSLPEEDQQLYAEIVYSWMITRMNEIKRNFDCDYLYIVQTDTDAGENPYGSQVFLMSAAAPGSVRGTDYGQVYTLGVTVSLPEEDPSREYMKNAVEAALSPENEDIAAPTVGEKVEKAGNYLDYYTLMEVTEDGGKAYLVGSTYDVKDVLEQIRILVLKDTLVAMLLQFLLANMILGHILVYMMLPLKKVLGSIRSYTQKKDSKAVEEQLDEVLMNRKSKAIRRNEIGQLAEDFVSLTKEIDSYTAQIEREAAAKERLSYELEMAAQIQLKMLPEGEPQFPDHPEFELCASMTPAKMVGGDFYDYFLTDDHHIALVMADVSDKGIPAALFMAESKALIKSQAQTGKEPAQILTHVNHLLTENNDGQCFVTVWMAIIDLRTGEGLAANAGHEHPALCRKGGSYKLEIYKHSPMVGMIESARYRQHTFRLNPGDCLYVYTDGVPEASNEKLEQFGTERMLDALNRSRDKSPAELLAAVGGEIDAFMGDAARFDDTTMMCFCYHGMTEQQTQ